jgi:intein/homing endonuclease
MNCWRITKYNPTFRDIYGSYQKNEWTSISDIGETFDGKRLTTEDYIRTENLYIDAIIDFLKELEISGLKIDGLEKNKVVIEPNNLYTYEMTILFEAVKNQQFLSIKQVECISRLILREQLWAKLSYRQTIFVHFGYDFYMYIGCEHEYKDVIKKIEKTGLFVEPFESPYI